MPNSLRIAAVIPIYNRARFIEDALNSIRSQSRRVDSVVVVDDGSTDNSVEVVRTWQQANNFDLTLLCQKNQGASAARNNGIRNAEADLIAPLDSDDVWLPDHVELLESAFLRHPELVLSAGNTDRMDSSPHFKRVAYTDDLFTNIRYESDEKGLRRLCDCAYKSLLQGAYIHTSSCMFRRQAAEDVGLFETGLRSFEDQQFFLRLSKKGCFGLYMEPITLIRKHGQNLTHRRHIASHILCAISVLERAVREADQIPLTDDELQATRQELQRLIRGAANRASRYGLGPYLTTCKGLWSKGYVSSLLSAKPLLRAMIRPRGDRSKLQMA